VEYVSILELTPRGELLLRAGFGWTDGLVGHARIDAGRDSVFGCTLRGNEPVLVEDLRSDVRFGRTSLLHDHGVVSGMSVVIHGPQGPYGTLSAHSTKPRCFTVDDANFLQTIANVVAGAIERRHAEAESGASASSTAARRLADIGVLTTKIVHDVGNPLAGLSMLAARIMRRIDREPTAAIGVCREAVEEIESTVHRLDAIIRDFKSFARVQRLELEEVHLPTLLKEVVGFLEAEATARGIGFDLDSGDPPPIKADREKLRRVIDNLVKNALEAIAYGPGTISIASHRLTNEKVRIMIADDGPGIPAGVEAFRLFRRRTRRRRARSTHRCVRSSSRMAAASILLHGRHVEPVSTSTPP
jgi:signal transduction histidine kinase